MLPKILSVIRIRSFIHVVPIDVYQNCSQGANRCLHAGCAEAKLLHLHLKTCSAGSGVDCPTNYNGCNQARKLLSHFRRCRSIRARQAGQHPSKVDPQSRHICLICSLVARQAKSVLETGVSPRRTTGILHPKTSKSTPGDRKVISSFTLSHDNMTVSPYIPKMPPPPPRETEAKTVTPGGARTEARVTFQLSDQPPEEASSKDSADIASLGSSDLGSSSPSPVSDTVSTSVEVSSINSRPRSDSIESSHSLIESKEELALLQTALGALGELKAGENTGRRRSKSTPRSHSDPL